MNTHEENRFLTGLLEAYRILGNKLDSQKRECERKRDEINSLKNDIEQQRDSMGRLTVRNVEIECEKVKVQKHRDRIEETLRAARKAATNSPGDKRTVQQTLEDTRKALNGEERNEKGKE